MFVTLTDIFCIKLIIHCIFLIIISLYDFSFSLNQQDIQEFSWALKSMNVKENSMQTNFLKQNNIWAVPQLKYTKLLQWYLPHKICFENVTEEKTLFFEGTLLSFSLMLYVETFF